MASEMAQADVAGVFQRHHVRYEVHPYYVVWEQRPDDGPPVDRKIQAGFEIDLYGTLDNMRFPRPHQESDMVIGYFEAAAREIQSKVGQLCNIEVLSYPDSVILDTHANLQPEATLTIRISHCRGLDQSAGPAEEQALKAIRDKLHELGAREA
jgi:hypothetical protein